MVENPDSSKCTREVILCIVMKTVTPIPTMSYSGKASIREVNIMAKFVETQMKSPIFSGKPLQK
jgi:hypothetical protein